MIRFLKRNKYLSCILIITIIVLLIGLLLPSLISKEDRKDISNNIIELDKNIKGNHYKEKKTIFLSSTFYIGLIWLLGISIIGIPIILSIYMIKVILLGTESVFLLLNLNKISILSIIIYVIPNIISVLLYFFLIYYALSYSIFLIKLLFLKKSFNILSITKQYIKVLLIIILINLLNCILEIYILPNILKIFI